MDIEIPSSVMVDDLDAAAALRAAGWTVTAPGTTPPDPGPEPGPEPDPDGPVTGWPTEDDWSAGGRLVASDDFAGPDLSPMWAKGIAYQCDYGGARPGWAKQAESQWNVPGVYNPDFVRLVNGALRLDLEYHPEGAPGPDGNNPAYYWSAAVCTCPAGFNGAGSGAGFAPVGFAFKVGTTPIVIEWKGTMPNTAPLDWTWQGVWLSSWPEWRLEYDLTESVGDGPGRPIQLTTHYSDSGGGAGDRAISAGPWKTQPQPGSSHIFTAVINLDASVHIFVDGNWITSNPAVNHQNQWCYWIHQGGLARPVRNYVPSFTKDFQVIEYFKAWQPVRLPVGTGIHGGVIVP